MEVFLLEFFQQKTVPASTLKNNKTLLDVEERSLMDIKGFRNIRQIKEAQNIPFLYCLILKSISNKRLGEAE